MPKKRRACCGVINKMKLFDRIAALALLLCLLPVGCFGEDAPAYAVSRRKTEAAYDSETLKYTVETLYLNQTKCYLTTVWVADPARQIKKAVSPWHQALAKAEDLGQQIPGAALVINGSGYVSPTYPDIPENYPGASADYYYTPLGSLTVIDGEVYRDLEGVPYYGLTLEADGLHLYAGADNDAVLAKAPLQTWSFYEGCPMYLDGQELLDREWPFATRRAIRNVIAKLPQENTYVILISTSTVGLTLLEANDFMIGEYSPEWVYNLDGGPSAALFTRAKGKKKLKLIYGAGQKIVDVMGFIE